jgi:hypothetical protein
MRVHMKLVMIMELRVVNFATPKALVSKSTMLPHGSIHKCTWTSPGEKTHKEIDPVFINRRQHSTLLHVSSFRGADCDTDHYLVVAKVRDRLAVRKLPVNKMDMDRFNLKKLNEGEVNKWYQVRIKNRFSALENLRR